MPFFAAATTIEVERADLIITPNFMTL